MLVHVKLLAARMASLYTWFNCTTLGIVHYTHYMMQLHIDDRMGYHL